MTLMKKKVQIYDAPAINPSMLFHIDEFDSSTCSSIFEYNSKVIGLKNSAPCEGWWKIPKYQIRNTKRLTRNIHIK